MVNYGINSGSILGFFDLILAIAYLAISIALPLSRARELGNIAILLYVGQGIIAPASLLLVGFIHIFQGWRLDPILQFADFLVNLLLVYLGIKDFVLLRLIFSRRNPWSSRRDRSDAINVQSGALALF